MKASLSRERAQQIQALFDALVDLDPGEWAARLEKASPDDPDLRREVASLLAAFDERAPAVHDVLEKIPQLPLFSSDGPREAPEIDPFAGQTVAQYRILEKLGGGGMGVVYKAHDTTLDRVVALKFLPPHLNADAGARMRFIHEAKAASALDHANICTIHEIGQTEAGQTFIAMACYDGQTLKRKIMGGALPVEEAVAYTVQIARGLARAHAKGIIHRDVKPANVMITEPVPGESGSGAVKILDFGLAKIADVQLTQTSMTMGTVAYMSPEQARGDKVDHRTDIWSLGVLLFEMLTGARPFKGDYDQAIIYSVLHEDPARLTDLNPEAPEALEHIVTMCLEKESRRRYASMADLLADLEVFVQDADTSLRKALRTLITRRRQARWMIAGGIGAFGVLLLITAFLVGQIMGPGQTKEGQRLAMLPLLNNLGESPENQALADGLMQSLTSMMARLETQDPPLWVVPAEEIRLKNVATPGDARAFFGVNRVVTGSVQRLGPQIELILNLIDPDEVRIVDTRTVKAPLGSDFQEQALQALQGLLRGGLDGPARQVINAGGSIAPDAYAFYLQGLGFLQRYDKAGNLDNAVTLFEQALAEDSLYALAHAGRCEAFWQQYRSTKDTRWIDQALQSCERAVALDDQLASVSVTRGRIYYEGRGDLQKAEAELRKALTLDPNNTDAYRWLGWVYQEQGRIGEAEGAFKQAIALKPDYWLNYSELGSFYFYTGRLEEAGPHYEQIIRLTPDNYIGYNNLGIQRLDTGHEEEARRRLEKSIALKPNAFAYLNLGRLHFRKGQYLEAAQMYENARALKENDDNIWLLLGEARYWDGDAEGARMAWQRFIALADEILAGNPNEKELLGRLAATYVALGDPDQGRAYIGRLFALPPPDAYTFHYVGRAYEMLGERDLALRYLRRALEDGIPPVRIETDPWLKALREKPGFQALRQQFLEPPQGSAP